MQKRDLTIVPKIEAAANDEDVDYAQSKKATLCVGVEVLRAQDRILREAGI